MTKGRRFARKRLGNACHCRPKARRPQLETLESRELLSGNGFTAAPLYLVPVAGGVTTTALLTTGDVIGRTGIPAQQYRMTGIPDGLGAARDGAGNIQLFMNHEFVKTRTSVPVVNAAPQTGAYVSRLVLAGSAAE